MLHMHIRSCDMLRISLKLLSTCELEMILWTYRDGDSHATVTLHHYCVRITWTGEASGLLLVLPFTSSGLIGSRCCCTVWTVQSALAPRGLVAETRSGYRSRVVMMSCNATGGLWRGRCSNDEPYQWIMGVLGVKGPQTLHMVASVVHTSLLQGVYESAEGGVCGSMCPYMGSVRLGELCSAGNAGRFLECLVAFVCARHESKTQTRRWMKS